MAKKIKVTEEEIAALDAEMEKEWRQEAIDMLHTLERQMYIEDDKRSNILRQALDLLAYGGCSVGFKPTKLVLEY